MPARDESVSGLSRVARWIGLVVLGVVLAEFLVRLLGLSDFAVYSTDAEMGYVPTPSTRGAFALTNDWAFNERSMGVARHWQPTPQADILLIGDSLVFGGNSYRQADKLGPALERELAERGTVWPVGAQSWTVLNQQAWLIRNRDVLPDVEVLVWIINSADFFGKSRWYSELTHPTQRPAIALRYLLRKYITERQGYIEREHLGVSATQQLWIEYLVELRRDFPKLPILLVWYPHKSELGAGVSSWFRKVESVVREAAATHDLALLPIGEEPAWREVYYRDDIHPTVEGNRVLATIIANAVERLLSEDAELLPQDPQEHLQPLEPATEPEGEG